VSGAAQSSSRHSNLAHHLSSSRNNLLGISTASQNGSNNPKKLMNDSLNMISKSRNKLINKSFQQQLQGASKSGSSAKRGGVLTSSITGDTSSKFGNTPNSSSNHQNSIRGDTKRMQDGDSAYGGPQPKPRTPLLGANEHPAFKVNIKQNNHQKLSRGGGALGKTLTVVAQHDNTSSAMVLD
jgi:hypothetical protein